jgi:eukaryotic translation initiation factor 2C
MGRIPTPDANVTQQENKLLQDLKLASSMSQLQVSKATETTESMPLRPAFGDKGRQVVLWANYFVLQAQSKPWYKYNLEVNVVADAGPRPSRAPEPKGVKLKNIVRLALTELGDSVPFASEYKSQVVSLLPLNNLPEDNVIRVSYPPQAHGSREYAVTFHGPTQPNLDDLLAYVNTMNSASDSFPVHEDIIDTLGVILGHTARTNNPTASVGTNKHFPLNAESSDLGSPDFNTIARGFFQSVRPATGRLLLNVNVAHGVFRFTGPATQLIRQSPSLPNLHRTLSRLGAKVKMLVDNPSPSASSQKGKGKGKGKGKAGSSSEEGPRHYSKETMICGLATPSDGSRDWRVHVPSIGANPDQVRFTINQSTPTIEAGTYSVTEYYKRRGF